MISTRPRSVSARFRPGTRRAPLHPEIHIDRFLLRFRDDFGSGPVRGLVRPIGLALGLAHGVARLAPLAPLALLDLARFERLFLPDLDTERDVFLRRVERADPLAGGLFEMIGELFASSVTSSAPSRARLIAT